MRVSSGRISQKSDLIIVTSQALPRRSHGHSGCADCCRPAYKPFEICTSFQTPAEEHIPAQSPDRTRTIYLEETTIWQSSLRDSKPLAYDMITSRWDVEQQRGGNTLVSSTPACRLGVYAPFFTSEFDLLIRSPPIATRGSPFAVQSYPSFASLSGPSRESFPQLSRMQKSGAEEPTANLHLVNKSSRRQASHVNKGKL